MKLLLLLAIVGAALVGGFSVRRAPAEARSNILWRDCDGGAQCGRMDVPLDHRKPSLDQIELALYRVPALDPARRVGTLFLNPGGPGGSGIAIAQAASRIFSPDVLEQYDIVGFDPRGVGQSTQIDCVDELSVLNALNPTPKTPLERQHMLDAATEFGKDCQRRSGALIQHVDTESVARDMDLIRAALGEEKISYLGFSYGTFIGAYYADLFPTRIRAMVLDGALDTSLTPDEVLVQGALGFEHALDAFFADCAAHPTCGFRPPDSDQLQGQDVLVPRSSLLKSAYDALVARLDAIPLTDGPVPLDGQFVIGITRGLMYNPRIGWPVLAEDLRQAQEGSSSGFLVAAGVIPLPRPPPTPDDLTNPEESFLAIACADLFTYTSLDDWQRAYEAASSAAPHFGPGDATFSGLPCAVWPRVARRPPVALAAKGAPPIVVVGTTNDPATPYAWAQRMAAGLESAVLLTYHGEGHTAYGGNSTCIDDAVNAYLLDVIAPAPGIVCEPDGPIAAYPPPPPILVTSPDSGLPPPEPSPTSRVGIVPPDTGAVAPTTPHAARLALPLVALFVAGFTLALGARASRPRSR